MDAPDLSRWVESNDAISDGIPQIAVRSIAWGIANDIIVVVGPPCATFRIESRTPLFIRYHPKPYSHTTAKFVDWPDTYNLLAALTFTNQQLYLIDILKLLQIFSELEADTFKGFLAMRFAGCFWRNLIQHLSPNGTRFETLPAWEKDEQFEAPCDFDSELQKALRFVDIQQSKHLARLPSWQASVWNNNLLELNNTATRIEEEFSKQLACLRASRTAALSPAPSLEPSPTATTPPTPTLVSDTLSTNESTTASMLKSPLETSPADITEHTPTLMPAVHSASNSRPPSPPFTPGWRPHLIRSIPGPPTRTFTPEAYSAFNSQPSTPSMLGSPTRTFIPEVHSTFNSRPPSPTFGLGPIDSIPGSPTRTFIPEVHSAFNSRPPSPTFRLDPIHSIPGSPTRTFIPEVHSAFNSRPPSPTFRLDPIHSIPGSPTRTFIPEVHSAVNSRPSTPSTPSRVPLTPSMPEPPTLTLIPEVHSAFNSRPSTPSTPSRLPLTLSMPGSPPRTFIPEVHSAVNSRPSTPSTPSRVPLTPSTLEPPTLTIIPEAFSASSSGPSTPSMPEPETTISTEPLRPDRTAQQSSVPGETPLFQPFKVLLVVAFLLPLLLLALRAIYSG
ncbi:hypothetical protein JAAARDRAFT_33224 [Jaapia argillacea MUCL 33604]|uniref:Uncharacterized protein n=1 Tax=Jaapia argillacea MUCL 33604 TaxID=933084 RepID=A0A067Q830_9AGAM|nr:hypothetical protein JAAARDRAFT_33224 [Jaapia argillacea MUCL 33604]